MSANMNFPFVYFILQVTQFKYLEYIIQNGREIEGDVNNRIQARQMKCRSSSGVICDRKSTSQT